MDKRVIPRLLDVAVFIKRYTLKFPRRITTVTIILIKAYIIRDISNKCFYKKELKRYDSDKFLGLKSIRYYKSIRERYENLNLIISVT